MTNNDVPWPKDVFKRPLQVGDYIAAGMSYGQSSVLRVGLVVGIKQSKSTHGSANPNKFSIRVRWRNNGDLSGRRYWEVKDSNILYQENYSYSKFMILDPAQVLPFPPDIEDFNESV